MRFQIGIRFPYPRRPRGPGRSRYRMSRAAHQARLHNLASVERARSHGRTRAIELEIALGTHRGESYRAMARRLGLRSHAHCWRVARKYRAGLIQMLPSDEQQLEALRDSLGLGEVVPSNSFPDTALVEPARANVAGESRAVTTDESIAERRREVEEWKRENRSQSRRRVLFSVPVR